MEDQQDGPKRRIKRRTFKDFLPRFVILLALLFVSLYFLFPLLDSEEQPAFPVAIETTPSSSDGLAVVQSLPQADESTAPQDDTSPSDNTAQIAGTTAAAGDSERGAGGSGDSDSDPVCQEKSANIDGFFQHLDSRDYIQAFALGKKSSVYFPALIQRLVDKPPVVTGETSDLFTILQNTAHFFRIIGKKNILILKGILDREKATFEMVLADFYELTQQPQCLEKNFDLKITSESIYLYSGFFLNTMGGRLYLFRRDSMSRMVVNFYAILTIENANRQGRNKYGIEITSSVNGLIDEIESSKIDLKMRDYYLDTLYDLKEKYQ